MPELGKGKRRDLAILDSTDTPVVELEAKALYSFDVTNEGRRRDRRGIVPSDLLADHAADIERLRPAVARGEACFLLSLVTHLMARVPPELFSIIKYYKGHNAELVGHQRSPEAMHEEAAKRWPKDLKEFGPLAHYVSHELGDVHGVPIRLDCYLVGPLTRRR